MSGGAYTFNRALGQLNRDATMLRRNDFIEYPGLWYPVREIGQIPLTIGDYKRLEVL